MRIRGRGVGERRNRLFLNKKKKILRAVGGREVERERRRRRIKGHEII